MRLLIIRHGDPDYEHDTLTEAGRLEVQLLAERMKNTEVDDYYVSTMGRAKDTIAPMLSPFYWIHSVGENRSSSQNPV